MRVAFGSARVRGLAAAIAVGWLCVASPARAEGGGADAGTLQGFLDGVCATLNIPATACPQYPTIAGSPVTELVLEIAGLLDASPEAVRYGQHISPALSVTTGNPPLLSQAGLPVPEVLPDLSPLGFLSSLTPLAFITAATSDGPAAPAQLYNRNANSFFYAAITQSPNGFQLDTLNLFYDYPARISPFFFKGRHVADISLPMMVANSDGTERPVPAVLQVRGAGFCSGRSPCYTANIVADFLNTGKPQQYNPTDLGINFALVFAPSPLSHFPHAIFEVQVPLLMTFENDPAYVFAFNTINNTITFTAPQGFTPAFLGKPIGIAPSAALGPPATPGAGPTAPFTARFANAFGISTSSVAAFLAISRDAETLVSAPFLSP